jgi:acetylornithine aminotransferase
MRSRCDDFHAVNQASRIDRCFRTFVEQCGLYRTGGLWAHSAFGQDCNPDIITMAKPLANGYPIGAVMMREEIAQVMSVGKPGNN